MKNFNESAPPGTTRIANVNVPNELLSVRSGTLNVTDSGCEIIVESGRVLATFIDERKAAYWWRRFHIHQGRGVPSLNCIEPFDRLAPLGSPSPSSRTTKRSKRKQKKKTGLMSDILMLPNAKNEIGFRLGIELRNMLFTLCPGTPSIDSVAFKQAASISFPSEVITNCNAYLRAAVFLDIPLDTAFAGKSVRQCFFDLAKRITDIAGKPRTLSQASSRPVAKMRPSIQPTLSGKPSQPEVGEHAERIAFRDWLRSLQVVALRKMAEIEACHWKRHEIELWITEKETEFAHSLRQMELSALLKMRDSVTEDWQKVAVSREVSRLEEIRNRSYWLSLSKLNSRELRAIQQYCTEHWKLEEIERRIAEKEKLEAEEFAGSIAHLAIDTLEKMSPRISVQWKLIEIEKRLKKLKKEEFDREVLDFVAELRHLRFESLLHLAMSQVQGWQNDEVCRRIEEMLPKATELQLERLGNLSCDMLSRLTARAQSELKIRRLEADRVHPEIKKGWV